jgi:hypothetical protein
MKILMLQTKKLSETVYGKTRHALGCNEVEFGTDYVGAGGCNIGIIVRRQDGSRNEQHLLRTWRSTYQPSSP